MHPRQWTSAEFVDDRGSFEEEDPADKFLGVFHLVDGAFFKVLVQLFVSPVGAHFRMNHVLADGGQFIDNREFSVPGVFHFLSSTSPPEEYCEGDQPHGRSTRIIL